MKILANNQEAEVTITDTEWKCLQCGMWNPLRYFVAGCDNGRKDPHNIEQKD